MAKDKTNKPPARAAEDKKTAAAQASLDLIRKFGAGTLIRLGDRVATKHPCIPTGIYSVDNHVIQAGGIPRGRITELFGPTGGGKTTLALQTIAEAQSLGDLAAFVDAEHALDPRYARALGVDLDSLHVNQPDSGEQGLEVAEHLIRSGAFGVVVVDSVAALVPQAELNGEMGDAHVGLQARMMSSALRKLTMAVGKTNTALVFINQLRSKIGVMYGCFNYNARVVLADGSVEKIGKIVNQRLPVEVLSLDQQTGEVSAKPVVGWHDNGNADYFLQIETTNGLGRSGKSCMSVTPNHMILTPEGECQAGELEVGSKVLSLGKVTFSPYQMEVRPKLAIIESTVVNVYRKPPTRSMRRFDITVDGNHTYFVDGVAVHNSPETTSGGNALPYYASLRLDIRRTATNKVGEEAVSNTVRIKAVKNRLGPPYRETLVPINFGSGFDKVASVITAGIANGAIEKSGSWLSFGGERLGQGGAQASKAMEENTELYQRVYAAVLEKDQMDKERAA